MMNRTILLFILLLIVFNSFSQNFNNYVPLKCSGEIPEEFLSEDSIVTISDAGETEMNSSHEDLKNRRFFVKYSNFHLRYILQSGNLVFGDPLTNYVNKVADILLKNFPDIRSQFHFYVTKFSEVNAACLPNGIVIVNVGLLAHLENEAQLAYVIAHEIIHYIRHHGIKSYVEQMRIKREIGVFSVSDENARFFALMQYERDNEFEADYSGFREYYCKSGYKLSAACSMFDLLLYGKMPVIEVPIDREKLEDDWYKIPDNLWVKTIDPISVVADFPDDKLTHPNIKRRKAKIEELLNEKSDSGSEYILPFNEFNIARQTARFELIGLFLNEKKYIDALYLSYTLTKEFPDSRYLKESMARSLFGIVQLIINRKLDICPISDIKGESYRLFYLINNFSEIGAKIFCCRELWKIHCQIPDDNAVSMLCESALHNLFLESGLSQDYFVINPLLSDSTNPYKATDIDTASMNYQMKKVKLRKAYDSKPERLAFESFADNIEFANLVKSFEKVSYGSSEFSSDFDFTTRRFSYQDSSFKAEKKIMILDPVYFRVSDDESDELRLFSTIEKERNFLSLLKECSSDAGIDVELVDMSEYGKTDVNKYNDYLLARSFLNEIPGDQGSFYVSSRQTELNELCSRMGTSYVAEVNVLSIRLMRRFSPFVLFSLIVPPSIPIAICYSMMPRYFLIYQFNVYDISTGKLIFFERWFVHKRDHAHTLKHFSNVCFKKLQPLGN